jgi:hypothetical protein
LIASVKQELTNGFADSFFVIDNDYPTFGTFSPIGIFHMRPKLINHAVGVVVTIIIRGNIHHVPCG